MVWFRNSMADSCSNLNRSRTELLASISSPTCSGRFASAWKLRISWGGLLSSSTRKSACFRSVMRRPCLSVTVKTTFTSLVVARMVVTGSTSPAAFGSAAFCPCAAAGGLAGAFAPGALEDGVPDCAVAPTAKSASTTSLDSVMNFVPKVSLDTNIISAGAARETRFASTGLCRDVARNVSLDGRQKCLKLPPKRTLKCNSLARPRMCQLHPRRMQEVSRQRNRAALVRRTPAPRPHLARRTIQYIAHHRMTQRSHMHPNLMRPAGIDLHLDQRELAKGRVQPTDYAVVRDRIAPARSSRRHPYAPQPVAADAGRNRPSILLYPSMHQRNISFLDLAPGKLGRQLAMRFIIFRHYDQPAGLFVQPMHNPRSHLPAQGRERRKMMQQRIDQRPAIPLIFRRARPRMHHHPRSLVDDRQIVVFINDVERNLFSDSSQCS